MLNEYEKNNYDVISKLISQKITLKEAMELSGLKERQIYNLKKFSKNKAKKVSFTKVVGEKILIKKMMW